jgi:hypothetical protein
MSILTTALRSHGKAKQPVTNTARPRRKQGWSSYSAVGFLLTNVTSSAIHPEELITNGELFQLFHPDDCRSAAAEVALDGDVLRIGRPGEFAGVSGAILSQSTYKRIRRGHIHI